MKIAFLGLGQMGSGIAARLLGRDHELTVWNRSEAATRPFAEAGANVAASPAKAVKDAEAVFTMLTDDDATKAVVFGNAELPGFLDSMQAGAVHVSLSTISVALARQLTAAHNEKRQHHLGAPVFGRPNVAAEGKLWLALAGEAELVATLKPVLERFSRGISIAGAEPWQAHALKLGGNFMITATIQMMSEAFVYAAAQGIEPAVFLEAVNSALFQSAFIGNYGKTILNPPEKPGATVSLGIKDTRLFLEAAGAKGLHLPLADSLAGTLDQAKASGWENDDWAVGQYKVALKTAARESEP